jgi:quercetin dioxygenase-like cupin family protein
MGMSGRVTRWTTDSATPWQVLANGAATDGRFLIGEARIEPGAPCPPQHIHTHEHESIYLIEGVLTVELGDERIELEAGDCLIMPPGIPHRFANLSDGPVRAVGTVAPVGIEKMFAEEEAYFASLDGPPDPMRIAEILQPYGVKVFGPPLTPAQ